jgi:hypothetical protein
MTIRIVADNFGILQRNGYDLTCPLISNPDSMTNIIACNTTCPLFKINDNDTISVCCGAIEVVHKIEKIIEQEVDFDEYFSESKQLKLKSNLKKSYIREQLKIFISKIKSS